MYLLFYVVLPFMLLSIGQGNPQIKSMLDMARSMVGIDVVGIASTIMILGVVMGTVVLVKNLTDKWSTTNFVCEAASTLLQLGIWLTILGAGDIGSFGVISRTVQVPGPSQPSFTIDMKFFALALTVIAGVKILLALGTYLDARRTQARRFSSGDLSSGYSAEGNLF